MKNSTTKWLQLAIIRMANKEKKVTRNEIEDADYFKRTGSMLVPHEYDTMRKNRLTEWLSPR